ncbi:3-phosphoshikimate 1-carboxyvinyltransferase [Ferruginibacter sp. SUN002]|uniref:3-phosphoshikimate 1-carboxyvinyltransferase n=1 Tax=Ferruginibacter sp. SUN002 TaxID=2937789 RepID=UPI003D36818E
MIVTVHPSTIKGNILAPTSKSSMQRACAAALLQDGETTIYNPGKSNDDLAAIDVIQKLGATIVKNDGDTLVINTSSLKQRGAEMNCGESGLGIRMFTPLAALSSQPITINGTGSLLTRPMDFFDDIFPLLGIEIKSLAGKLPLQIKGPLQPADITIDGSLSSQFLTGLLMAYGKAATKPATITVKNLKSKPYIDLTLQVMKHFGYDIVNNNYESFTINPKAPNAEPIKYTVEGDWSGGAFLVVAGAIAGGITIKGLDVQSTQADKKILEAVRDSGALLSITDTAIEVAPPLSLKAFQFDATDCPDLFPPLVALASYCNGTTAIQGVNRLAHKESNRGLTLQDEFGKMGVEIILQDDLMLVKGGTGVKGATVHSRHDHRIAMACATAALKADGDTTIEEAEAINKSYPDFYEHMKSIGGSIEKLQETISR